MTRVSELRYEFVRLIPEDLTPGTLYISVEYATASHLCCCGCGFEVVTPLSPTDWKLTFDGESVSLHPSIGNWAFACQSHYWINRNRIQWAGRMTPEEIAVGRELDRRAKREQFGEAQPTEAEREPRPGLLGRLRQRVRRAQSRLPKNDQWLSLDATASPRLPHPLTWHETDHRRARLWRESIQSVLFDVGQNQDLAHECGSNPET